MQEQDDFNNLYLTLRKISVVQNQTGNRKLCIIVGSNTVQFHVLHFCCSFVGYAVAQLVEALRYKPERRGIDSVFAYS